jgi:hypothetical protein
MFTVVKGPARATKYAGSERREASKIELLSHRGFILRREIMGLSGAWKR